MKRQALEKEARSASPEDRMVRENELLPPNAKGGECYTRVFVPPTYKTVTEKVLKTGASERIEVIPAQYKTVKKKVMTRAPTTRSIEIPGEYATITRTIQTNEGQMAWRRILCETNTTPHVILKMQQALEASGHSPGHLDGIMGPATIAALTAYQRKHGLARGGVTYATLEKLGVVVSP